MTSATVSIVFPAYNEEGRLPRLLHILETTAERDLSAVGLRLLEAVVVDDGSTDGTVAAIRAAARDMPLLRPVALGAPNTGKGAAVAAGVRAARGELTLIADVDLSTPLDQIGALHDRLQNGAHIAIGSRALRPELELNKPRHRQFLGRRFNQLSRSLTGLPHRDTQCGFKLLPTALARDLLAEQIVPRYAFDVELLMRARAAGLSVAEVPVLYVHDRDSRVTLVGASARMATDVVRLAYRLRVGEPLTPRSATGSTTRSRSGTTSGVARS
jgi:dolichyl-phosphate beta-glucosyltransferase